MLSINKIDAINDYNYNHLRKYQIKSENNDNKGGGGLEMIFYICLVIL